MTEALPDGSVACTCKPGRRRLEEEAAWIEKYRQLWDARFSELDPEVTPHSRLVWTNDEAGDAGQVTTVTFEERGGQTLLVVRDLYPSKEALDEAIASGSTGALPEQFEALDELLVTLDTRTGRA